jgi:p-aminobenzoyl-glutamate transporter AbgT
MLDKLLDNKITFFILFVLWYLVFVPVFIICYLGAFVVEIIKNPRGIKETRKRFFRSMSEKEKMYR